MIQYKFSRIEHQQFTRVLRQRVAAYFKENNLDRKGNHQMVSKTVASLGMYIIPYVLCMVFAPANLWVLFGAWIIMGLGNAFIGTSIMHDSLHGSYSRAKWLNRLVGSTAFLCGADPKIWQLQHNVLHHTYTNIDDADEDIAPRYVLRFSPNQPRRWFHRYQHLYAIVFYSISTITWVIWKDYIKVFQYKNKGLIKPGREFWSRFGQIVLKTILYFFFMLALPMLVLPVSPSTVVALFVVMHVISGSLLTLIFQPAHVVPNSKFIAQEEEEIEENWLVHQLATTSNFGTRSKFLLWVTGGLNFQVEHHLFPDICHVHYPSVSKIVRQTVEEFQLPYFEEKSFLSAVRSHFRLLKLLGKQDQLQPVGVQEMAGDV